MTTERPKPSRETPLGSKLKARIRREGPLSIADYMAACLGDPAHGYYRRQTAIGAEGDFITAPEISQTFGELIGLWCAVAWQQMGAPGAFNLVELGPGRGTLMRDALRAARVVPGFREAVAVHLVDSNETLRGLQRRTLADSGVDLTFHADAFDALSRDAEVPPQPTIVIANEFLDTLPIAQLVLADGAWRARVVTLGDDGDLRLALDSAGAAAPAPLPAPPQEGDILETCAAHASLAAALGARAALGPLAALLIDYGHAATGYGDTLQGIAGQRAVSPLEAPGETDLSAHVDFQSFGAACRDAGLGVDGPLPQGEFLGRLGIVERASRLMAANPAKAAALEAGVARLLAPTGMGSRFLALGVRSQTLAPLPGLADSR